MTLIDRYLPEFQFCERHQLLVNSSPEDLLDAVMVPDVTEDPWLRTLVRLRELPDRLWGALGGTAGLEKRPVFGINDFTLLGRDSGRELAFGLVGKFWQADYGLVAVSSPGQFEDLAEPGVAKLVLNFSTQSLGTGRTRPLTETRVFCNDRKSTRRFTPYWWLIRPVSGLIRHRLLARIRDTAATANDSGLGGPR